MRVDDIKRAIEDLPSEKLEALAVELVGRSRYPDLLPTSHSHDLGEDARTSHLAHFVSGSKYVSLAVSKTATTGKIINDCDRCRETNRRIDMLVFVTSGNPTTGTQENWREKGRSRISLVL